MEVTSLLAIIILVLVLWIPVLVTLFFLFSLPFLIFKMFRVGVRTYSVLGEDWKDHIQLLKENKDFWQSQIEIGAEEDD